MKTRLDYEHKTVVHTLYVNTNSLYGCMKT